MSTLIIALVSYAIAGIILIIITDQINKKGK